MPQWKEGRGRENGAGAPETKGLIFRSEGERGLTATRSDLIIEWLRCLIYGVQRRLRFESGVSAFQKWQWAL
jgi:hypothetical protein